MKIKIKSIFIILLLIPLLMLSYPKKANAVVTEGAVAIGGIAVTGATLEGLVVLGGAYAGYKLITGYEDFVRRAVLKQIYNAKESISNYINTYKSADGSSYVGLTENGKAWSSEVIKSISSSSTVPVDVPQPSNTDIMPVSDYVFSKDGYTCKVLSSNAMYSTIDLGILKTGDTISIMSGVYGTDSYNIRNFSYYTVDKRIGFTINNSSSGTYARLVVSDVDSSFTGSGYGITPESYTTSRNFSYYGYKISSNTVYVPGTKSITNVGIDENVHAKQGTIAVPVSPDVVGGQDVYVGSADVVGNIGNVNVGDYVVDGLKSDTVTDTGTDTGSISETLENIWDSIIDIPKNIAKTIHDTLEVPINDIPTLDFSPLMVATQKFPFCIPWDLWNSYKVFEGNSVPFMYEFKEVKLNGTITGGQDIVVLPNFKIDFSEYPQVDVAVQIFKYLQLLLFIVMLVIKTRSLIRG